MEDEDSVIADLERKKKESEKSPIKKGKTSREENVNMARKTRYLGYLNGLQKKDNRGRKTSTKESVLSRLKDLKGKECHMTIPVNEGEADAD